MKENGQQMNFVVTTAQMKAAEEKSNQLGVSLRQLMENAGRACFNAINEFMGGVEGKTFVILCGRGNNGGDGLEITSLLNENGADAVAIYVDDLPKSELARECYSKYEASVPIAMYTHNESSAKSALANADVIVDCIFGTGFNGTIEEKIADLLRFVNSECKALKISVDIPSGINADTGIIAQDSFVPHVTYILGAIKQGMLSHPCFEACGNIVLLDIGINDECYEDFSAVVTDDNIRAFLPERPKNSNKGTFGTLLNIAGSGCYPGAALLSSRAAARTGAGLVALATPKRVVNAIASAVPEVTFAPLNQDENAFISRTCCEQLIKPIMEASAIAVGCGLGNSETTRAVVKTVLDTGVAPVIIDADGINSICNNINVIKDNIHPLVLTPHPKEFSRMTNLTVDEVQADRVALAKSFAKEMSVVLVLKGVNTIIAAPDGRTYINPTGNSALAAAGTGDVLTGMIGSFMAQGVEPFYAAALAAYLHGKCADELIKNASPAGIIATDIVENLPFILK